MRDEYDNTSKHGLSYDILSELYDFEFSNENVSSEKMDNDYDKFKKKELINILVEIDEFQDKIEYDRYISCNHCDNPFGRGYAVRLKVSPVNPELVDDGEGKDPRGKKSAFCNGKGKASLGFEKCPRCNGDKIVEVRESVKIKEKDFKENKLILQFKGNASRFEQGKVGNLYIKLKDIDE